jgi:predicted kinase
MKLCQTSEEQKAANPMNTKTEFETLIRTTKRLVKAGHKVVLQFDTDEECEQAVEMLLAQSISLPNHHQGTQWRRRPI